MSQGISNHRDTEEKTRRRLPRTLSSNKLSTAALIQPDKHFGSRKTYSRISRENVRYAEYNPTDDDRQAKPMTISFTLIIFGSSRLLRRKEGKRGSEWSMGWGRLAGR